MLIVFNLCKFEWIFRKHANWLGIMITYLIHVFYIYALCWHFPFHTHPACESLSVICNTFEMTYLANSNLDWCGIDNTTFITSCTDGFLPSRVVTAYFWTTMDTSRLFWWYSEFSTLFSCELSKSKLILNMLYLETHALLVTPNNVQILELKKDALLLHAILWQIWVEVNNNMICW